MVLVPLLGRTEQANTHRAKQGRLQVKKATRQSSQSEPAKRSTSDSFPPDSKSPKALKNKNWRARRDGSPPLNKTRPSSEKENTYQDSGHPTSTQSVPVPTYNDQKSSASQSGGSFVQIVNQMELLRLSSDGASISLFEVTPLSEQETTESSGNKLDIAKIQQVRAKTLSTLLPEHTEPDNLRVHAPGGHLRFEIDAITAVPGSEKPSGNVLGAFSSREVVTGMIKHNDMATANDIQVTNGPMPKVARQQPHHVAKLQNRDLAFQKIIERLNNGKADELRKDKSDHVYQWPVRNGQDGNGQGFFRKPINGSGRRNATNSDFRINYWDQETNSQEFTEANDSDTGTEVKHNNLNPRAREFLSIGYNPSFTAAQPNINTSQKQAYTIHDYTPGVGYSATTSPTRHPRPYKTFPGRGAANGVAPSYPQQYAKNLPPAFNSTQNLLQQLSNSLALQPAIQAATLGLPFLPTLPPTLNTRGFGPTVPPAPYIHNNHSTACSTHLFEVLRVPNPTISSMGRSVVPKPRVPDANGQQAYEAWIEWRKANEPGYAIECKIRQQRRSQRNKGTKARYGVDGNSRVAPAAAAA